MCSWVTNFDVAHPVKIYTIKPELTEETQEIEDERCTVGAWATDIVEHWLSWPRIVESPTSKGNHDLECRVLFLQSCKFSEELFWKVIHGYNIKVSRANVCKREHEMCQCTHGNLADGLFKFSSRSRISQDISYHSIACSLVHPGFIIPDNTLPDIASTLSWAGLLTVTLAWRRLVVSNDTEIFCHTAITPGATTNVQRTFLPHRIRISTAFCFCIAIAPTHIIGWLVICAAGQRTVVTPASFFWATSSWEGLVILP